MNALTNLDFLQPQVSEPEAPLTGIDLFRDRRERAVALWNKVPEQKFYLGIWRGHNESCGTVACALGWLGEMNHDGWHGGRNRVAPGWTQREDLDPIVAAALYFGLALDDSVDLFSGRTRLYPTMLLQHVTPIMVGHALMTRPYVTSWREDCVRFLPLPMVRITVNITAGGEVTP